MPVRALTRIVVPPLRIAQDRSRGGVSVVRIGRSRFWIAGDARATWWCARRRWRRNGTTKATDPRQLAAEADVDLVVSGTLLRSGAQLRITAQLHRRVERHGGGRDHGQGIDGRHLRARGCADRRGNGAVVAAAHRTVSIGGRPPALRRDVPANPRAFELFLRGMEASARR